MTYIREDQASMRVSVTDPKSGAIVKVPADKIDWATYSGGALEATAVKVRPGGMGHQKSVGGPASRSDVTMTIQMRDDILAIHNYLESITGVARVSCFVNFLDVNGNPSGVPNPPAGVAAGGAPMFTRVGTLKSVALPEANADGTAVGFYTLVIDCDEDAT
jgi:hypothetical protein